MTDGQAETPKLAGILNDGQIREACEEPIPLITPYSYGQNRIDPDTKEKIISWGTSSAGYDIRLANTFAEIAEPDYEVPDFFGNSAVIDPKHFDERFLRCTVQEPGTPYILRGHSYVLSRSVEKFNLSRHIQGTCVTKSTYARCGIVINVTPLEPGWSGYLTLEIFNASPVPCYLYPDEGIAQIIFNYIDPCATSYSDRKGKYQNQGAEIVLAKV